MCVYIYIYIYIYDVPVCICIYIYIYGQLLTQSVRLIIPCRRVCGLSLATDYLEKYPRKPRNNYPEHITLENIT